MKFEGIDIETLERIKAMRYKRAAWCAKHIEKQYPASSVDIEAPMSKHEKLLRDFAAKAWSDVNEITRMIHKLKKQQP